MAIKQEFLNLFGSRISELRKKRGLSYRELAQRCDIDHSDISKIEKGQKKIQLPTVLELAIGLGVHPKELFDFEIPMTKH